MDFQYEPLWMKREEKVCVLAEANDLTCPVLCNETFHPVAGTTVAGVLVLDSLSEVRVVWEDGVVDLCKRRIV